MQERSEREGENNNAGWKTIWTAHASI
jgi:hypothetical protein